MALFVSVLCLLIALVCYYLKRRLSFWRRHGVEEWSATSIFGNFGPVLLSKGKNEADISDECYKRIRGKFGGYYFFWKPILLVKEPELIKKVLIKDFEHFADRSRISNFHDTDEIMTSIFFGDAPRWKPMRMAFSHLFTPRRLKSMTDKMTDIIKSSTSKFLEVAKNDEDIDGEKILSSIFMDVITLSFIGIGLKNQDVFHHVSHYTNFPTFFGSLKVLLYNLHPQIYDFFRMTSANKKIHEVFTELVKEVLEEREKSNYEGDDFFEFLIKCKNGENKYVDGISDAEIASHVYTFFFAGHDTTASTASFVLYELARNPKIQTRLRDEIQAAVAKNNGLTYDAVKDVAYLQWIIQETTRMYPLLGVLKRTCTKPYKFDDYEVPLGTEIIIPNRALHYDPEYFENPDVFNPERFANGNRTDVFMPFGQGPRICIGMKFAQIAVTLMISSIILEYNLKPSKKNMEPFKYVQTTAITNKPLGGIWFKMELRNEDN